MFPGVSLYISIQIKMIFFTLIMTSNSAIIRYHRTFGFKKIQSYHFLVIKTLFFTVLHKLWIMHDRCNRLNLLWQIWEITITKTDQVNIWVTSWILKYIFFFNFWQFNTKYWSKQQFIQNIYKNRNKNIHVHVWVVCVALYN